MTTSNPDKHLSFKVDQNRSKSLMMTQVSSKKSLIFEVLIHNSERQKKRSNLDYSWTHNFVFINFINYSVKKNFQNVKKFPFNSKDQRHEKEKEEKDVKRKKRNFSQLIRFHGRIISLQSESSHRGNP